MRLFRQNRKPLVVNKRVSTYLLYASGEVLLIVVGILLALQLDNWNDRLKTAEKAEDLSEELYAELLEAREQLASASNGNEMYTRFLEDVIQGWDSLSYDYVDQHHGNPFARKNLSLIFYITSYSQWSNPEHEMYTKASNDGSISLVDDDFVDMLSRIYKSGNKRINQFIDAEYALSQSTEDHIAHRYADLFREASRDSTDWDRQTYETLFQRFRDDGVLRYKLDGRLRQMRTRGVLYQGQLNAIDRALDSDQTSEKP